MSYRPYPRTDRAAAQIRRATAVTRCRICRHPVSAHRLENGVRRCTRARGPHVPSCQDCAQRWEELPLTAALAELGRHLQTPPSGPPVLTGAAVYRD